MRLFKTIFLLLVLGAAVLASATDVYGILDHTSPTGLALANGEAYSFADGKNLKVSLPGGESGGLSDIKKGDSLRVVLDSRNRVVSIVILPKVPEDSIEVSLKSLLEDSGWSEGDYDHNAIIGRRFKVWKAIPQGNGDQVVSIINSGNYDVFDCYVGAEFFKDGSEYNRARFTFIAEEDVLFQTSYMKPGDHAVHVRIPIRGYKSLAIQVTTEREKIDGWLIVGDPVFARVPRRVPMLTAPLPNAQIKGNSEMTWEKVDGVDGYVLELQCLETALDADATSEERFKSVRLPAGTTNYVFDAGKMPKGRWRWRVHTLSGKSVVGEMGMWRVFRST